jgi:hypothetical protein
VNAQCSCSQVALKSCTHSPIEDRKVYVKLVFVKELKHAHIGMDNFDTKK